MQTFSASGIAERLERDRGTVIKALRGTAPDRMLKGKPQWKLSTASRAIEAHMRGYEGGNNRAAGVDLALQSLYDRFDFIDAAMRALPTLEARRAAARKMTGLIHETDRAFRAHGRSVGSDPELIDLRADKIYCLIMRGFEGPCDWDQRECWEQLSAGD